MLTWEAIRIRPTSKKNRHLVLAVASGCFLMELFLICPPFLIGCVIWKRLLFAFIFSTISQFIFIVLLDLTISPFCLIYSIAYSVKVTFRQDKYFFNYLCFCEFLGSGLYVYMSFLLL